MTITILHPQYSENSIITKKEIKRFFDTANIKKLDIIDLRNGKVVSFVTNIRLENNCMVGDLEDDIRGDFYGALYGDINKKGSRGVFVIEYLSHVSFAEPIKGMINFSK